MSNKKTMNLKRGLLFAATVLVTVGMSGCSVLNRMGEKEVAVAVASEQPSRERYQIEHSATLRDVTTGERKFVFCSDKDCVKPTLKSVSTQPRTVKVPATVSDAVAVQPSGTKSFQVGFSYDSSQLNDEGIKVLEEAAAYAADRKAKEIRIHGKADSFDRDSYNLKLAEKRARTAERFLKGKKLAANLVVDASVVRVSEGGVYPPGETFKGRRVDLDIVIEVVAAK